MTAKRARPAKRKKRSGGVLMKMRDAPKKRPPENESAGKKIAKWTGGGVLMVIVLGAVVVLAIQFFQPKMGQQILESDAEVIEVRPPEGESPALATVVLQDKKIHVPLVGDDDENVEVGSWIRVTYQWIPRTRTARVQGWTPADPPPEPADESASDHDPDSPASDG